VNIDRKPRLSGQIKLPDKPVLLHLSRLRIPVVIEPDLADRHDLFLPAHLPQLFHGLLIQLPDMVRVHARSRIDKRVLLCQPYCMDAPISTIVPTPASAIPARSSSRSSSNCSSP